MEARELPVLAMLEDIRHQLMGWFAKRRALENGTPGAIVSRVASEIQKLINERARRYHYIVSTEELFEVKSKETLSEYIVNLTAQTCSCRRWQFTVCMPFTFANLKGYPCGHALAIILGQRKEIKDYVIPCFTLESFRNTYAGAIIHPHNIDFAMPLQFNPGQFNEAISDDEPVSESEPERALPPNTRRQPGRP